MSAEIDNLRKLVKDPYPALHALAASFFELSQQLSAISRAIDEDQDDDKYPLVHQIEEALRHADAHICGTDIAMASDHGAWFTKNGWQPKETMPLLRDLDTETPPAPTTD